MHSWAAARPRDRHTRASLGASPRSPARPRHRPRAPQSHPYCPAGPAAASNRAGLGVRVLAMVPPPTGTTAWLISHPGRCTLIAESTFNFACNSLTALSNHEFRLLELQRFQMLLKLLSIELHATFLRPGSVVTFGLRGQVLRLEVCLVPPVSATPGVLRGVA